MTTVIWVRPFVIGLLAMAGRNYTQNAEFLGQDMNNHSWDVWVALDCHVIGEEFQARILC